MEWLKEIGVFLWAVLNNWAGYVTGGLVIALIFLWTTLKQKALSRTTWIVIVSMFFSWAVFSAWREQYEGRRRATEELDDLTKPKLRGVIQDAFTAKAGDNKESSIVTPDVMIVNTGAPSIATNFSVSVALPDGREVKGVPIAPPPPGSRLLLNMSSDPNHQVTFDSADFIVRKGREHPIPTGGAVSGFCSVLIRGVSKEVVEAFTLVVRFTDIDGSAVEARGIGGKDEEILSPDKLQGFLKNQGSATERAPIPGEGRKLAR